jgi:hypothetical protein
MARAHPLMYDFGEDDGQVERFSRVLGRPVIRASPGRGIL